MIQSMQQTVLTAGESYRAQDSSLRVHNEGSGKWKFFLSDNSTQSSSAHNSRFKYQRLTTLHDFVTEVVHEQEMGDFIVVRYGPASAYLVERPRLLIEKLKQAEKDLQLADNKLAEASSQMFGSEGSITSETESAMRDAQQNRVVAKQQLDCVRQECIQNSVDEALHFFEAEIQLDDSDEYDEYGMRVPDPSPAKRKSQYTVSTRDTHPRRGRNRSRSRTRDRIHRRARTSSRSRERSRDRRLASRRHSSSSRDRRESESNVRIAPDPSRISGEEHSSVRPTHRSGIPVRAYDMADHQIAGNLEASTRAIDATLRGTIAVGDHISEGYDALNSGVSRALETQELGANVVESFFEHEN